MGPGAYNPDKAFHKMVQTPCPAVVKPLSNMQRDSAKGLTQVMEGGGIVKDLNSAKLFGKQLDASYVSQSPGCSRRQRRSIKSVSASMQE